MNMVEPDLLTTRECQRLFDEVAKAGRSAGVRDVELTLAASESALTRFANNAIHQNVAEKTHELSVRVQIGQRTARAGTNRMDADSIRRTVEEAAALARAQAPLAELQPLLEPQSSAPVNRYAEATARVTPAQRAQAVIQAIHRAESESLTAAGIFSSGQSVEAILNSNGLFVYHPETDARFSITVMGEDSSGWAKVTGPDRNAFDADLLAQRAVEKVRASAHPIELPPARYTVILEPAAVLDLIGQMMYDFSATAIRDQRSFLCGRLGEKLFGENIMILDDVRHPLQKGAPFDGEGMPREPLLLVENGVPKQVAYSRSAAVLEQTKPTGHGFPLPNEIGEAPLNIVMQGGESTLEEMIASTERGILVTRFWYIREVDPFEKIMTGMTRDGTFLVEGGRITRGLRNFRFNQSLVELLRNVEQMTASVPSSGEETFDMVVPGIKARDFLFTEVTRF